GFKKNGANRMPTLVSGCPQSPLAKVGTGCAPSLRKVSLVSLYRTYSVSRLDLDAAPRGLFGPGKVAFHDPVAIFGLVLVGVSGAGQGEAPLAAAIAPLPGSPLLLLGLRFLVFRPDRQRVSADIDVELARLLGPDDHFLVRLVHVDVPEPLAAS